MRKIVKKLFFITLVILAALSPISSHAEQDKVKPAFHTTEYPLPRFVSLGAKKIFVRAGPGPQYPIKWVYEKEGLPVEITLEYETWRKIRDIDGQEGWVHQLLLSGKRTILIKGDANVPVRAKPEADSRIVAYMQPKVMGMVDECRPEWCQISSSGYKGWVERMSLWGIYPGENFKK